MFIRTPMDNDSLVLGYTILKAIYFGNRRWITKIHNDLLKPLR